MNADVEFAQKSQDAQDWNLALPFEPPFPQFLPSLLFTNYNSKRSITIPKLTK